MVMTMPTVSTNRCLIVFHAVCFALYMAYTGLHAGISRKGNYVDMNKKFEESHDTRTHLVDRFNGSLSAHESNDGILNATIKLDKQQINNETDDIKVEHQVSSIGVSKDVTNTSLPTEKNNASIGHDAGNLLPNMSTSLLLSPDEEESFVSSTNEANKTETTALKFFIIPIPEYTTWLVGNYTTEAINYYKTTLNEDTIEVWLNRAYSNFTFEQGRVMDPSEADVFMIPAYLAFRSETDEGSPPPRNFTNVIFQRLYNISKPHLFLVPANNPGTSQQRGIRDIISGLVLAGVNMYSVGIERNPGWQGWLDPSKILPIPYQVKPALNKNDIASAFDTKRNENFVFYAGNPREHSFEWGGCNRSMLLPLKDHPSNLFDVGLYSTNPIKQEDYNSRMSSSDYCLIICGDTPTSRSLASAVVHGCLPLRIGSRLRGLCEKPCFAGWGWTVTGETNPHLPYTNLINWSEFPEVNEYNFSLAPFETIHEHVFEVYTAERKDSLRHVLREFQLAWIYGWGNPIDSTDFGEAAIYIWQSFQSMLQKKQ